MCMYIVCMNGGYSQGGAGADLGFQLGGFYLYKRARKF